MIQSQDKRLISECISEASNLKKINSPNVIKLYDSFYEKEGGFFFFITEVCEHGTLQQFINL